MTLDKIVSGILSDLYSGLAGINANPTIPYELIEDEVVEKRQGVILDLFSKNLLKTEDLMVSLNCVNVNCENMVKCDSCKKPNSNKSNPHFEIPQLLLALGENAINYIGSADGKYPFRVYFSLESANSNQYRRRGNKEPYVYIDPSLNSNQMHDCWLFNAPFVKQIKVSAVFKDLRQLEEFSCCRDFEYLDFGIISDEVKKRVKQDKFAFYRQNLSQPYPTNTTYR